MEKFKDTLKFYDQGVIDIETAREMMLVYAEREGVTLQDLHELLVKRKARQWR